MNEGRRRARKCQQLEMLVGVLGFFTLMAFITAVVGIVGGDPGLTPSLVLLGCVLALLCAVATWRRNR